MRRIVLFAALVGGVLPLVVRGRQSVDAGTAVRLDLEGLVERADLVFEGRIVQAVPVETPRGRIETELRVAVDRHFVGAESTERVVRVPGGVLPDGRGLVLPGMPRLQEGEELILFLSQESIGGARMPVGLAQGKLRVLTELSGERVLAREPVGLTTLCTSHGEHHEADGWEVFDYAETISRLRAAADRRSATGIDGQHQGLGR